MRYYIEQRGGKWFIVHPSDPELTWVGNHWADVELWGTPALTFASFDQDQTSHPELCGAKEAGTGLKIDRRYTVSQTNARNSSSLV